MNPITLIGQHGTPTQPLVIDGGGATIDGGGVQTPVFLDNCSHVEIRRVNACRSGAEAVRVKDSRHITLREVCAWDAHPRDNRSVFGLHGSRYCQVIDCAGWGTGRKVFDAAYAGDDIEWRRCFGRWDASECPGPKSVFVLAYNSYRNVFRDCLGYVRVPPNEFVGIFAADRMDNGAATESLVDGCCGVSGNVCFAFHPTTVRGILFANCVDYTAVQKLRASNEQLARLRWIWSRSPVLARVRQLAGVDPLKLLA